jgi:hypothetical protein
MAPVWRDDFRRAERDCCTQRQRTYARTLDQIEYGNHFGSEIRKRGYRATELRWKNRFTRPLNDIHRRFPLAVLLAAWFLGPQRRDGSLG